MPNQIFNKPEYKQRRQDLRNNMPELERRLWSILRNQQMGVKFRRQHGIGHYITDFYSPEIKLVIELDGDSHFNETALQYDAVRDKYMMSLEILVIRICNQDVMNQLPSVGLYLQQQIEKRKNQLIQSLQNQAFSGTL